MEARGPAVVPAYEPVSPPDRERSARTPDPGGRGIEWLTLLWRERGFLWGVAWKTLVAAIVVAYLLPVHYEGVTRIVPAESQGGPPGLLGKLEGTAGASSSGGLGLDPASLLGLKTPSALYVEMMKSRTVQDRLIDRFNLRRHYWMTGRWSQASYYATRKKLTSFTDFQEDKKSGVITLTYTDYDKHSAATIANAYVEELNRLAADLNTSEAHRERVFLEERLKSAKQDLDQASLALSRFSSTNTVMDPQDQGRSMIDAAAKIQGQLIAGESELRGLREIYSDENVKVRTLKAQIGELQGQLKRMMSGSATGLTANSKADELVPSMRTLPILGYQYAGLYRQTRIQETVYEFLTQKYELAKIQEAKELPTVRQMDVAVEPERKSGPIRTLVVALSVLAGLVLASFWVIGYNAWMQLPDDDPRRMLAAEFAGDVKGSLKRLRRGAS